MIQRLILSAIAVLMLAGYAAATQHTPVKPTPTDKCPVCGMFVAKYPDFVAQVIFRDGAYAVFDGAKDMFKYYLNPAGFGARKQSDIDAVFVTDYYSLKPVDGSRAFYVIGSDVYGPMGRELIPFERRADAEEFKKDHKGTAILGFRDITADLLKGLD
jgi:nitrous oxide reductase accessory protein NosL